MPKRFRIPAEDMKPLAPGRGSCIASDRITVDGAGVGFMYRESPDDGDDLDSGWRFLSGDESEAYVSDPAHFEIYDVNTHANYDPTIFGLMDRPAPCAFERDGQSGAWVPARFPDGGIH